MYVGHQSVAAGECEQLGQLAVKHVFVRVSTIQLAKIFIIMFLRYDTNISKCAEVSQYGIVYVNTRPHRRKSSKVFRRHTTFRHYLRTG